MFAAVLICLALSLPFIHPNTGREQYPVRTVHLHWLVSYLCVLPPKKKANHPRPTLLRSTAFLSIRRRNITNPHTVERSEGVWWNVCVCVFCRGWRE
uniref:Putative secreted protein n=1 Tax=Anopheles triannulatus TaxID=58253 RepID=A0A2M4B1D7_9DIPT